MNIAVLYTSVTGNTEELAALVATECRKFTPSVDCFDIQHISRYRIHKYDVILLGSYTWGNGDIPEEMESCLQNIINQNATHLVKGLFGTGDSFYPHYCGALDKMNQKLKGPRSSHMAMLKIELSPQPEDEQKCQHFLKTALQLVYL